RMRLDGAGRPVGAALPTAFDQLVLNHEQDLPPGTVAVAADGRYAVLLRPRGTAPGWSEVRIYAKQDVGWGMKDLQWVDVSRMNNLGAYPDEDSHLRAILRSLEAQGFTVDDDSDVPPPRRELGVAGPAPAHRILHNVTLPGIRGQWSGY